MKLGFMFVGQPTPEAVGATVRRHGFAAVEIAMPIDPGPLPEAFCDDILACARRLEVPVALHEALTLALANRDRAMASRIRARIEQTLDLAIRARLRVLTLHTTSPRTRNPLLPGWKVPSTRWLAHEMDVNVTPDLEEARGVFVDLLRALGPRAAEGGAMLAVENNFRDTRYFGERIDSLAHVLDILRRAGAPGLGVCFDVYKAVSTEPSLPDAIRSCGDRIVNVHLSDFEPTDTTFHRPRRPLGAGSIDWHAVLRALQDAGYDGPMILEMLASDEDLRASRDHFETVRAGVLSSGPARG